MSKRHTLGVSKWLPSTKDKITFKKGGGELDQFLQNCFDDGDDGVIITIIITITTTIITKKNPKIFFSRNEIYMP